MTRYIAMLAVLLLSVPWAGCKKPVDPTADDLEREVSLHDPANMLPPADDWQIERDTVVQNLNQELAAIDAQLQLHDEQASQLPEEARQEWESQKGLLAERMRQLEEKLEELERASSENWQATQAEVGQLLAGFRLELRETLQQHEPSPSPEAASESPP